MTSDVHKAFIETVGERCRMCYTCVRECPAKAIRIIEGQAEIIPERCIACGNCVKVCSQHAKQLVNTIGTVRTLLNDTSTPTWAIVAPSFPAEFPELDYRQLVGMVRRLGFTGVCEVAFGADLVADRYKRLLGESQDGRYIASTCPAIFGYVERYFPDLVGRLAPIVSPMVAMARVLRATQDEPLRVVFIGPCIAKKIEADSKTIPGEIDAAITFKELAQMFQADTIAPDEPSDFDPPHAGPGALFAISRGLLQAAKIEENLLDGQVIATEGRTNFVEAMREFETGSMDARLLEVLACQGCIMGPGISRDDAMFRRRSNVSQYVRQRLAECNPDAWRDAMEQYETLDLSRCFRENDQRLSVPFEQELSQILRRLGKVRPEDELNCGACGYDTCREHAIAIFKGLAESEMCLPYTIDKLRTTINELASSNEQLASTQEALMHSEKLASMGQLAAGIAHEVNNPLGVVLMYAHLLLDECKDRAENAGMQEDLTMIAEQADRCKKIVSGLLHFARQNKVLRQPTDLNELIDKSIETVPKPASIQVSIEHGLADNENVVEIDRDQIIQVITNLVSNAYAAMDSGGTLTLRTEGEAHLVRLHVSDMGCGIAEEHRKKIFEPFFTTKQMGKGTGLGLAVAYGIIKMHKGNITVESNADPQAGPTGTTFTIELPRHGE
jgi:signal transduction histidine kinase/Fe-S-cluster-containing hydrogenase component 2